MFYPGSGQRKPSTDMTTSTAVGPTASTVPGIRRGLMTSITPLGSNIKKKEYEDSFMTNSYFNQSSFMAQQQQRTDKDGMTPTGLYGGGMSTSGFPNLSARGITNTPPFTRSSTAPTGAMAAGGVYSGGGPLSSGLYGAPSPPPPRNSLLMNSMQPNAQGMAAVGGVKHVSRPNTLASAISSGLPMNSYQSLSANGRGMVNPFTSSGGYPTSISEVSGSGFDPTEFPVLGMRSHNESGLLIGGGARPGYAGQISKPTESSQEFQMRVEDFPSLPGTNNSNTSNKGTESSNEMSQESPFPTSSSNPLPENRSGTLMYDPTPGGGNKERSSSVGAIGSNKTVTRKTVNVPPTMVQDHYGMVGLLTFIRGAETDPNLVALALGSDLTTLGLNLNSPESLYSTFSSPFADSPSRPQDIDYAVPQEYLIHSYIRDKLAPIRLSKYNEDLLFYLYYTSGGDLLQLLAAHELYSRDWRYYKEEKIWITRAPNMRPTKVESTYEEGTYCYFDLMTWRKAHRDMKVEYDRLAERPAIPPAFTSQQIVSSVSLNS